MTLLNLFETIKKSWGILTQIGVLVFTIASTFLIQPPLLSYTESSNVGPINKFIITAVIALVFIMLLSRNKHRDYKGWYLTAFILFVLSVACIVTYYLKLESSSEPFYEVRLVKGENMLSSEQQFRDSIGRVRRVPLSDEEFIRDRTGMVFTIWPADEINYNFKMLVVLYTLNMILVALFLITVVQAINCYNSKT